MTLKPGEFRINDRTPRHTLRVVTVDPRLGTVTVKCERLPDLADYVFRNDSTTKRRKKR